MNSAQRRKQRRFMAPLLAKMAQAEGDATDEKHTRWRVERRLFTAMEEIATLRESTGNEIRKLTESAKKYGPLVAELRIALQHVAVAAAVVDDETADAATADVPSVNELRQRVIAALKGNK